MLTHGLSVSDVCIGSLSFSDPKPVMFTVYISCHNNEIVSPARWSRVGLFGPTSVSNFSVAFNEA